MVMSKQTQTTEEKNEVNGFDTIVGIIQVGIGIFLIYVGLLAFI